MAETEEVKKSNRPQASKFKQQKLDAWQPILTPGWVIGTFLLTAVVFVPIGASLLVNANSMFEQTVTYDNGQSSDDPCVIDAINQGYIAIQNGTAQDCLVTFTVDRDLDVTLNLYYELTDFFQNHRRYVQSRSDSQLRNEINLKDGDSALEELEQSCDPEASLRDSTTGLLFYPCGLIATSFFNDGIQLSRFQSNTTDVTWTNGIFDGQGIPPFELSTTGIAWDTDLAQQFRNPIFDNGKGNALQYGTYAYLWQTYDQMSCYNTTMPEQRVQCITWPEEAQIQLGSRFSTIVPNGTTVAGTGCASCPSGSTAVYEGGIRPPTNYNSSLSGLGLRTESFVVWMRTAALPNFRKPFGSLVPRSDFVGFKKGDIITFRVVPNFLVQTFGGTKSLVLSTVPTLGGKNGVLGVAYLVVGLLCLVLAFAFFLKLRLNPRKLGDPKYLHWKQQ